jgi:putative acetyltransferase
VQAKSIPFGSLLIREEAASDVRAIADLTAAAFEPLAISSHTEQHIVAALRAAGALTVSLVAEIDGRVVGHVACSPVDVSDGSSDWYGLGPVSVLPALQRRGIGSALIRAALTRLRGLGARGCCLVGHPAYYGRFGFANVATLGVPGAPPEAFFAMAFDGRLARGEAAFHAAFAATGPPAVPARS